MNARVILGIAIAVIGVWGAAAAQFTILFGQQISTIIVTVCTLTVASLGAALGVLSTQTNQVTSVHEMAGVDSILVNAHASPALAKMAMDPAIAKVEPMDDAAKVALTEIAKG